MDITELKTALGDELFEQVAEKVAGVDNLTLINKADGKWIPKARFDAERQTAKSLQEQITDLNNQLAESAKTVESTNESYKAQIGKLQETIGKHEARISELTTGINERDTKIGSLTEDLKTRDGTIEGLNKAVSERDANISGMRREAKIRKEVAKFHPKDDDLVYRLIDQTKIGEGEDGSLTGIDEQIEDLKKEHAYMFGKEYSRKGGVTEPDVKQQIEKTSTNEKANAAIRAAFAR